MGPGATLPTISTPPFPMKPTAFLPLLLLLGAATPALPVVQVTSSSLTQSAWEQASKKLLKTAPRVTHPLHKQGQRLVIPLAKGQRVFTDKYVNTDRDDKQRFTYAGYLPATKTHVVIGHFWEENKYVLLPESGRETVVYSAPVYSPDGRSFAVATPGLEYGAHANAIRLFRYEAAGWREVWHTEPKAWEPDSIGWTSPTTLLLRQQQFPANGLTRARYAQLLIK